MSSTGPGTLPIETNRRSERRTARYGNSASGLHRSLTQEVGRDQHKFAGQRVRSVVVHIYPHTGQAGVAQNHRPVTGSAMTDTSARRPTGVATIGCTT